MNSGEKIQIENIGVPYSLKLKITQIKQIYYFNLLIQKLIYHE